MVVKSGNKSVAAYMRRDVVAVNPRDDVHEALRLMIENRVAALPVVTARGVCVGMISTSDLIELAYAADEELERLLAGDAPTEWLVKSIRNQLGMDTVESVMSSPVATVRPTDSVSAAAQVMVRDRVHRLPVVDEEQHLLGILSTMDIVELVAGGMIAPEDD